MFLRIHPSVIYSLPSCLAFGCELCVFTLICDAPAILKLFCLLFGRAKGKINPALPPSNAETKRPGNLSAKRNQKPGGTEPPRVRTATRKNIKL